MNQIKKIIKRNYKLYKILFYLRRKIHVLNFLNCFLFKVETSNRKKVSIFDFKRLSKDLTLYSDNLYQENFFYGNYLALREALKIKSTYKYLIEHGYHFGNFVSNYVFDFKSTIIVTYSQQRVKHIQNAFKKRESLAKNVQVITIGPYINYATELMAKDKIEAIKKKYGKILLVFPSHSIKGITYKYNIQDFISEIDHISKSYDSVFVCMYWKDIQDGRYVDYEKKGYKIVTAGHRSDPYFLCRLKDIIELSDITISNSIGTHIGYCVARGKPHYLFHQYQEVDGENVDIEFKDRKNKAYVQSRIQEENEVIDAFSKLSNEITEHQQRIVDQYWGKNEVKYYTITKENILC